MRKRPTEDIDWVDVCPKCGRVLVTVYNDGTFDLAGRAGVETQAHLDHWPPLPEEEPITMLPVPGTGRCDRCDPTRPKPFWRTLLRL